jgi:hypothetical protein
MFNSTTNQPAIARVVVTAAFIAALAVAPLTVAQEHQHGGGSTTKEITGEVVDLMCYLDHGASGEKHASCAAKCIKDGGPVGLKSGETTYLIVGEHKPINDQLADEAGKEITVKGKVVERGGLSMIENAEIVKK